ncbi:MAG: hypothetical protein AAGN66_05375 [Acidobacteriota bacterium]
MSDSREPRARLTSTRWTAGAAARVASTLLAALTFSAATVLPAASAAAQGAEPCEPRADDPLGPTPWRVPFEFEVSPDPAAQQGAFYDFMWRTFIALNWPALEVTDDTARGQPDCGRGLFDDDPRRDRVWQTFPGPLELFPPRFERAPDGDFRPRWGRAYPTWSNLGPPPGVRRMAFQKIPRDFAVVVNQPGLPNLSLGGGDDFPTGPLVDQNRRYVRYQVGINRSYFEYLRKFEYYDRQRQIDAVEEYLRFPGSPEAFQPLPGGFEPYVQELPPYARHGMVEIKAAWRVLDGVPHKERYLQREVTVDIPGRNDGKTELMGLVALHILRRTPQGFVASTFEQVDNVEVGHSAPKGLTPSFNTGTPPTTIQSQIGFENRLAASGNPAEIPAQICADRQRCGAAFNPPVENPEPVAVYRVAPIPATVERVNAEYQAKLYSHGSGRFSPLAFYRLIGTQNRHPGNDFADPETNGHEGPITGVYTNANNLINTALESYTQKNISCIYCHVGARPWGVTQASFGIDHFKILSFLMRRAQPPCSLPGRSCGDGNPCCAGECSGDGAAKVCSAVAPAKETQDG